MPSQTKVAATSPWFTTWETTVALRALDGNVQHLTLRWNSHETTKDDAILVAKGHLVMRINNPKAWGIKR